jgi:hypothetical protein
MAAGGAIFVGKFGGTKPGTRASIMKLSCISSMLRSLAMDLPIFQQLKTGLTSLVWRNGARASGVMK